MPLSSSIRFHSLCGVALTLNKTLVKEDQFSYQADLEAGYEEMRVQLKAYLPTLGSTCSLNSDGAGGAAGGATVDAVLSFIGKPQDRRSGSDGGAPSSEIADFFMN